MSSPYPIILPVDARWPISIAYSWRYVCANFPPGLIEVMLVTVTQILCFWIPSTLLLLLDLMFPTFSNRHKIQSERRQPTWPQIRHCIQLVAVNTINGTLIQLGVAWYMGFQYPLFRVSPGLPSINEVIKHFAFTMIAREIFFYYSHRTLHHPQLYRHIHK